MVTESRAQSATTHQPQYRLRADAMELVLAWDGWNEGLYRASRLAVTQVAWAVRHQGHLEDSSGRVRYLLCELLRDQYGMDLAETTVGAYVHQLHGNGSRGAGKDAPRFPMLLTSTKGPKRTYVLEPILDVDWPPDPWEPIPDETSNGHPEDPVGADKLRALMAGDDVADADAEPEQEPEPADLEPLRGELQAQELDVQDALLMIMRLSGEAFRVLSRQQLAQATQPVDETLRQEAHALRTELDAEKARHDNTRAALKSASAALREAEEANLMLDANLQAVLRGERVQDMSGYKTWQRLMQGRER